MQATYVAALDAGRITDVAAHCWNGMVLVQAPSQAAAVAREAVRRSGRSVTGFSGPWDQVVAARRALGLATARTAKDSRDELYVLDRKSTRLNSSHVEISYAVFCLKKKKKDN